MMGLCGRECVTACPLFSIAHVIFSLIYIGHFNLLHGPRLYSGNKNKAISVISAV